MVFTETTIDRPAVQPDVRESSAETERMLADFKSEVFKLAEQNKRMASAHADEIGSKLIKLYVNIFRVTNPDKYVPALERLDRVSEALPGLFPETFSPKDVELIKIGARAEIATMRLMQQSEMQITVPSPYEDRIRKMDLLADGNYLVQTKNISLKKPRDGIEFHTSEMPVFTPIATLGQLQHFLMCLAHGMGCTGSDDDMQIVWREHGQQETERVSINQLDHGLIEKFVRGRVAFYEVEFSPDSSLIEVGKVVEKTAKDAIQIYHQNISGGYIPVMCILNGSRSSEKSDFDFTTCQPSARTQYTAGNNLREIKGSFREGAV